MSRSATSKRAPRAKRPGKRKHHPKGKPPRNRKSQRKRQAKARIGRNSLRLPGRAATPQKPKRSRPSLKWDPRLEIATKEMNRGRSLTAAAREARVTVDRLRKFLTQHRLAKRKGQRWVTKDNRARRVPVMTRGRFRVLTVRDYREARLVGEHHHACGEFVRTNDIRFIEPFRGQFVRAVSGRRYPLETDPNVLHRIAAMDTPPFHEIYEITSNT
jgi:hypothetical protein